MQEWLIHVTQTAPFLVYGVIFIIAMVEGPILTMLCGLLYKLGYFPFAAIFLTLIIGDLFGDTVWYFIGYYFGTPFVKRFGKYIGVHEEEIERVKIIFHKNKEKIIIISKLTNGMGLSLVVLLTTGIAKIPFIKYLYLNTIGETIWTGALFLIGYFFGHWYIQIDSWMGKIGLVGGFIVLVILFIKIRKYFVWKTEQLVIE